MLIPRRRDSNALKTRSRNTNPAVKRLKPSESMELFERLGAGFWKRWEQWILEYLQ